MIATPVLILPGLGGSGAEHWQSLWEASDPAFRRVEQRDWDYPDPEEWLATLHQQITACAAAPVLVAHSLACSLVAHCAARYGYRIKAALLVSPSDVESPEHTPPEVRGFGPMPLLRFAFPSIVVASTDDPCVDPGRAKFFAEAWGSRLVVVPAAGHLNAQSGLGEWPQGRALLQELLGAA